jgi:hypothetical protein
MGGVSPVPEQALPGQHLQFSVKLITAAAACDCTRGLAASSMTAMRDGTTVACSAFWRSGPKSVDSCAAKSACVNTSERTQRDKVVNDRRKSSCARTETPEQARRHSMHTCARVRAPKAEDEWRPHLRRDWAPPSHICAGTGPRAATSALGIGTCSTALQNAGWEKVEART